MSITPAVSHGTQVEQSRAVAEVFAAAELATRFPRDESRAEARMLAACSRPSLAEVAEYALPRGGRDTKDVTGPSVHLARELGRIWGNITHGVVEISRNNVLGQSELMAYAWDVEGNVRSARTFIVPHTRDKNLWDRSGGKPKKVGTVAEAIDTQQDITNQNNSVGARQLRETIFSVLPKWFTEDAIRACKVTLERVESAAVADDQATPAASLGQRARDAVKAFVGEGITQAQVEKWAGRPVADWDPATLARVRVLWRSLRSGDAKVAEVFPPEAIALADLPTATSPALPATDPGAVRLDDLPKPAQKLTGAERAAAHARELADQGAPVEDPPADAEPDPTAPGYQGSDMLPVPEPE